VPRSWAWAESWRLERREASPFLMFRGPREAWRALEQTNNTIEDTLASYPGSSLSL
jgi:hypothetical protein